MSAPLELQYTIVDAFTSRTFGGNPAAVIVLPPDAAALSGATLQLIGREFNLSETAFVTRSADPDVYGLRWFTPTTEVRLCGHATLASAHVLQKANVTFHTKWSTLGASKHAATGKYELAFPAGVPEAITGAQRDEIVRVVAKAFDLEKLDVVFVGGAPGESFVAQLLVHVDDTVDLAAAKVDSGVLTLLNPFKAIIITNRPTPDLQNAGTHFVSRVFGPLFGIPEDPVTGSAHCLLAPYWTKTLGRGGAALTAKQLSTRVGDLEVEWVESEGIVRLRGDSVTAATGVIYVPRE